MSSFYVCEYVDSRDVSLSSVMVLRRGVFSLFIPLKQRSAAQVDIGYVSKVTKATHIPLVKVGTFQCDRQFRPESGAVYWALK